MAAVSTKSTLVLQFTGSEAENAMRKLVFAAAVGIQDGALSNLAQPLVRIALKLLMSDSQHFKGLRRGVLSAILDLKAENGVFFRTEVFLDSIFSFLLIF